jgi:hypothetical protein
VLYLKRPRVERCPLRGSGRALQIQRLEGSRPGGLWGLYLDEPVLIVREVDVAVGALWFQLLMADRMVMGRCIGEP